MTLKILIIHFFFNFILLKYIFREEMFRVSYMLALRVLIKIACFVHESEVALFTSRRRFCAAAKSYYRCT